ncbi:hypothetical protein LJR290_007455 [Variovorax sp. LjRoot290]|uniref:hypothetical protein n=1 Tax=Variovorax sp. LjRoot290 TaxID=3342316 RepID=UPI003ECFD2D8
MSQLIATRLGAIVATSVGADGDSDGAAVLRRQHSLLADLQAAVAQGVAELDFAYEGEFDPVEASIRPPGETAFEKGQALHEIALAGIEPVIASARAAGIRIRAPELGQADEGPADLEPLNDRLGG